MGRGLRPKFDCGTHLLEHRAQPVVDMRDSGQRQMGLGIRHYLFAVHTWRSAAENCQFGFHSNNFRLLTLHQEREREIQAGYWGTERLQEQLHTQGCGENKR
jgi:hypothetical protein